MRTLDISPGSASNSPAEDNTIEQGNLWNKIREEIEALLPADRNRTASAVEQHFLMPSTRCGNQPAW